MKHEDKQRVYNRVRDHLLTQNKKAKLRTLRDDPKHYAKHIYRSVLRTPEGLTCSIGCLIPEATYMALRLYDWKEDRWPLESWPDNAENDHHVYIAAPGNGTRNEIAAHCLGIEIDDDAHQLLDELMVIHDESKRKHWRQDLTDLAHKHGLTP